jgi:hypothetical protein
MLMRGNFGGIKAALVVRRASHLSGFQNRQGVQIMTDYRVNQGEVEEDQFTAAIEKSTSKIPTSAYLVLALGAMAVSAGLQAWNKKHESMFVGQWAAPFLLLGIYNKLVKQHGSDGRAKGRDAGYIGTGESGYRSRESAFSQTAGL